MDLFEANPQNTNLLPPLAERMRPRRLEDFKGQECIRNGSIALCANPGRVQSHK